MDDTDDLVERLLVVVGGLMEDASAVAVLRDGGSLDKRTAIVRQAAQDVVTLVDAIAVIRRGS